MQTCLIYQAVLKRKSNICVAGLSTYLMVSWGLFADVIWQLNQARTAATQGQIMTPPALTDTRHSQSSKRSQPEVCERRKRDGKKSPLWL